MSKQPPSAEALEFVRRFRWANYISPEDVAHVLDRFVERVCEQRVEAERERAEASRLFLRALFVDLDADIGPLCQRLIEAYRAPAERPAPEGPPTARVTYEGCPHESCVQPHCYGRCMDAPLDVGSSAPSDLASTGEQPPGDRLYQTGDCPCGYGWNCKETGCRRPPPRDPKAPPSPRSRRC
jgi:hypothetical protein